VTILAPEALDVVLDFPAPVPSGVVPLDVILDVPGGDLYAETPADAAPDALRIAILSETGTVLVPDVKNRTGASGGVEADGPGALTSLTVAMEDFHTPAGASLLDPNNRVMVYHGNRAIGEYLMDAAPPQQDTTGRWTFEVSGRGTLGLLDNGVLFPEVWSKDDNRQFDYGSRRTPYGAWYVANQWTVPKGRAVRTSWRWTQKKRHYPKGWPEKNAQWIWSSSPETNSPDGPRWFRAEFTLATTMRVRIWAAGDDTLQLKMDGNVIMSAGAGGWKKASSVVLTLSAGTHVVAARVTNVASTAAVTRPSGFAFAMGRLNAKSQVVQWLLRSNTTRWRVTRTAPGWFPPTVLLAHRLEGIARGVQNYSSITPTFTSAKDSTGRGWAGRGALSFPLGASGTELVESLRAYGYSFAMLPGLRFMCWISRGRDLRGLVRIGTPKSAGYTTRTWSRVKTYVLTHAGWGWGSYATPKTALTSYYGRREMSFSAGNARTSAAARGQSQAALRDVGTPEETLDIVTSSTKGPQPFRDYDISDLIMVAVRGGYIPARVKSISWVEEQTKEVTWTTTVYPFAVPVVL